MNRREDIPLEGELNCWTRGFDLPDILLVIRDTGKTGLLRFENSEAEKTLFVRGGEIIFAKSSSVDDRLGEYLLQEGKLSLPDLSKLAHLVKPGKRLGTVLVENELLDPKELVQAIIGQVRSIILSLFKWTEARYDFKVQDFPSKETITLDMPTARLILDGVKLVDSWRRIAQGVGAMSSVYTRVEGNEDTLRVLDLDTTTLEVLATLAKPMSVEAISTISVLPDIEVCRLLWVFRCLGWVEQVEEREVESVAPVPATEPAVEASSGKETQATPVEVSEDETSFSIVEPDVIEIPKGAESNGVEVSASDDASIPTISTLPNSTPIPMVEPEPDQTSEVPVDDSGVSFADMHESSFDIGDGEQPIELESSPEILFEAQYPFDQPRETPVPSAPAPSAEPSKSKESLEPELELEAPFFQAEPEPTPLPGESPGAGESPDEVTVPTSESEFETDDMDMDIEGLGMVLGKNGKE